VIQYGCVEQIGQILVHGPSFEFDKARCGGNFGREVSSHPPIANTLGPLDTAFSSRFQVLQISSLNRSDTERRSVPECSASRQACSWHREFDGSRSELRGALAPSTEERSMADLHSPAIVALPPAGEIRQQLSINKQLRMVFVS
jgi:hypothetical protein